MAAHWCLCKLGGLLSLWGSSCCNSCFLGAPERKRPLDWYTNWGFCANGVALLHYQSDKLGRTGTSLSPQLSALITDEGLVFF